MAMTVNGTSGLTFNDGTTQSSAAGGIVPNVRFSDGTIQSSAAIPTHETIKTAMFGSSGSVYVSFNKLIMLRYVDHRNCSGVSQWSIHGGDTGWIYKGGNGSVVGDAYSSTCIISCWNDLEYKLGGYPTTVIPNLGYNTLTFSVTANFTQNTDDGCHTRIGNTWGGADVDASWGGYNNNPSCQTSNMNMSTHVTRTMTTNISISKSTLMSGNDLKLKFAARMPNGSNQTEGVGLKDVTISFVSWS